MRPRANRRDLFRLGGLAMAGAWASVAGLGCRGRSANDRLNIGLIGVRGRGRVNLNCVASENVVALCDVHEKHLDEAAQEFPRAYTYTDFREMLEWDAIDAVVVTTPDHVHAPATAMALRLGKHVYCEKPLTHSIHESRVIAELAAHNGKLATQMGMQVHHNYRPVVDLLRLGAIGDIHEVHAWTNRPVWMIPEKRLKPQPPPPYLHWDLWLGPAPEREYQVGYQPFNWRAWWDFGTGALGDAACHILDPAYWALELGLPTTVEAEGPPAHPEICPKGLILRYEYPARAKLPPVKLTWYEGGRLPPADVTSGPPSLPDNGLMFVGAAGKVMVKHTSGDHWLMIDKDIQAFQVPNALSAEAPAHHLEWIRACKSGSPTSCDFARSAVMTEAVLLGNVAYQVGRKIEWDARSMRAIDCPEADRYIRREYRKGWTL